MTDTSTDRLQRLGAELTRRQIDRRREPQSNGAEVELLSLLPAPKPTGFAAELLARHEELRRERVRAAARVEPRYEEPLGSNQPQRKRINERIAELDQRRVDETRRHGAACREIDAAASRLQRQLAELERVAEPRTPRTQANHRGLREDLLNLYRSLRPFPSRQPKAPRLSR